MAKAATDRTEPMALVGDAHRVDIICALVEHRREHPRDPGLAFSELHGRTGIDDKGKFNYHLDRLRDHYVEQVDDEYRLTMPGDKIAGALLAGDYEDEVLVVPTGYDCYECDAGMVVEFDAGLVVGRCDGEDEHPGFCTCLPPGAAEAHEGDQLLELGSLYWRTVPEFAVRGLCMECFGPESGGLVELEDDGETVHVYESICDRCGYRFHVSPGAIAARHPAVTSLYWDHGVDVREVPPWELDVVWRDNHEARSEDPLSLAVTASAGEDAVTLVLDETGTVTGVEEQ